MEPCKSIDLNFLQIYTGIGSARQHENQHFMLDARLWVNKFKELELLNAILLSYFTVIFILKVHQHPKFFISGTKIPI